jgi:soluble lytic murein transglycosylase-like protein
MGKDGRFDVAVSFDKRRGYVGSHPDLRAPVVALSLVGVAPQDRDRAAARRRHRRALPRPRRAARARRAPTDERAAAARESVAMTPHVMLRLADAPIMAADIIEAFAFHEAGHTVAAVALGQPVARHAAAPPSSVMNSRRSIIRSPHRRGLSASVGYRSRAPWRSPD